MTKNSRLQWAKETLAICEAGYYPAPSGKRIEIAPAIKNAVEGTIMYGPESVPQPTQNRHPRQTSFEVGNETTFDALTRLRLDDGHLGCLNFASAKNPGGGFLGGAQAQEEALARSSALYPCLLAAPQYYKSNRANRSTIYLELVIYSPFAPFFRNDAGMLIEEPSLASVITAPAPNAGAVMQNEPQNAGASAPALRRRAEMVLAIAEAHGIENLVLGAWGCGVFRNDPQMVAGTFADLLGNNGNFKGTFAKVVFAVFDRSEGQKTYQAFRNAFVEAKS